jgi:cytochrome c553
MCCSPRCSIGSESATTRTGEKLAISVVSPLAAAHYCFIIRGTESLGGIGVSPIWQNNSDHTMKNTTKQTWIGRTGSALAVLVILPLIAPLGQAAEVAENWTKHCASCHGKDGKGQTKAGRMAGVKDMTEAVYQAALKDDRAHAQIKDGLKDEKGKERMKPFKDKLTDDEIKALIGYVRSLKK